jgi:hypothetical protein
MASLRERTKLGESSERTNEKGNEMDRPLLALMGFTCDAYKSIPFLPKIWTGHDPVLLQGSSASAFRVVDTIYSFEQ